MKKLFISCPMKGRTEEAIKHTPEPPFPLLLLCADLEFTSSRDRNPKLWSHLMFDVGWGAVLDYIGVGWTDRLWVDSMKDTKKGEMKYD